MADSQRLSFLENLMASGIAVVGATFITHPIDVVKVRLQVAQKSSARGDAFSVSRFLKFWPELRRQEGTRVFYAGIQAAGWRAATYGSARIGMCQPLQELTGSRTAGALIAGVLATIVGNPFEVLKVRLQSRQNERRSMLAAFQGMVKEEGITVLARGFQWAAARSSLLTASQVVPYAKAKDALMVHAGLKDGPFCHGVASALAGLVTTTVTAPVDVLKTRVMSTTRDAGGNGALGMLKQEGVFVFFRGWLANYVRLGPQTLFIFVFLEQAKGAVLYYRPS